MDFGVVFTMLMHPGFNPIALQVGPVAIHWYGLMYLVGFAFFWLLGRYRSREIWREVSPTAMEDLLFYGVFGVIVGGRVGYCLFYQPEYYWAHPWEVFFLWQGGMSAHGGLLGCLTVMAALSRLRPLRFLTLSDFVAPLVPLGLFFGRIGNFINGELWGRVTSDTLPWAMVFPLAHDGLPRHPSQLYEAGLEGLALFVIVWLYSRCPRPLGAVSGLFALGYGVFRFTVEFYREPDSFLGLGLGGLSRGQWLSIPLMLVGALLLWWAYRHHREPVPQ